MSARHRGMFDIPNLDTRGMRISMEDTKKLTHRIVTDSRLRERLAKAEDVTGKQLTITAIIYGRNDGGNNVPSESEQALQEKIINEKKRLVTQ